MAASVPPLVVPFVGERYRDSDRLSALISPPYDVISPRERQVLRARNPHNVVRLIFPDDERDKYRRAAERLADWRRRHVLVTDDEPSVYVLSQRFPAPDGGQYDRTGLIGAVAVEPYARQRIKPHERTHSGPKLDRLALMQATEAMLETLLMVTRDTGGRLGESLRAARSAPPLAEAELDGVALTLWRITGAPAAEFATAASAGPLYIADGHHRYETSNAYRRDNPGADRTLSLIVPVTDPGLIVLATHRLIQGDRIDEATLQGLTADRFWVERLPADAPPMAGLTGRVHGGTSCVVVLAGGAYLMTRKRNTDPTALPTAGQPAVAMLDVVRVDSLVVEPLVAAAGAGARLSYTADPGQLVAAMHEGEAVAGVLVKPTPLDQVLSVADRGGFMPQKSTYFMPKVPSGLVVLRLAPSGRHGS